MSQPTKSEPLAQRVYDGLIGQITTNQRVPGDRLVEASIAREMDVSRTPVREALSRLKNDGLIRSARAGGYTIITPSLTDIREIFEIRRALEPVAFAKVVAAARPDDDDAFLALQAAVEQAQTPTASAHANSEFRAFWVDRIANARMRETLLRFHMQVQLVRLATLHSADGREAAQQGTARLAKAFVDRDTETAFTAMQAFVDAAFSFFQRAGDAGVLSSAEPAATTGNNNRSDSGRSHPNKH